MARKRIVIIADAWGHDGDEVRKKLNAAARAEKKSLSRWALEILLEAARRNEG